MNKYFIFYVTSILHVHVEIDYVAYNLFRADNNFTLEIVTSPKEFTGFGFMRMKNERGVVNTENLLQFNFNWIRNKPLSYL